MHQFHQFLPSDSNGTHTQGIWTTFKKEIHSCLANPPPKNHFWHIRQAVRRRWSWKGGIRCMGSTTMTRGRESEQRRCRIGAHSTSLGRLNPLQRGWHTLETTTRSIEGEMRKGWVKLEMASTSNALFCFLIFLWKQSSKPKLGKRNFFTQKRGGAGGGGGGQRLFGDSPKIHPFLWGQASLTETLGLAFRWRL